MLNVMPTENGSEPVNRQALNQLATEPTIPRLAFSMKETATMLGVSYQTVYNLSKRGLLKSSSALRTKLFAKSEIERFLKASAS
jgi:predicted DNA-binding transcriptional regulator AlpA